MRAIWNGVTIAVSDSTVVVEGNHYFPPESVNRELLRPSLARSVCPWKGLASYCSIEVDGVRNVNAAWIYPHPWPWIRKIRGHVAFWKGVEVSP